MKKNTKWQGVDDMEAAQAAKMSAWRITSQYVSSLFAESIQWKKPLFMPVCASVNLKEYKQFDFLAVLFIQLKKR